jgi:hypothetical protein
MAELEKLEHPKPRREFIYDTFNAFANRHPWVGQENIHPKSIAREMFETFRSFADFVRDYDLQRAEGLLLRHLGSVHKVLAQTVPDTAKTEPVREMELYLHTMIRQVDSSLLEEWEKMKDPGSLPTRATAGAELKPPGAVEAARDITRDTQAFIAAVRTRIFTFLRGLVIGEEEEALAVLDEIKDGEGEDWTVERLARAREAYLQEHRMIRLDPEARNLRHTHVQRDAGSPAWTVDQVLIDPEGHNDWMLTTAMDLAKSREKGEPHLQLLRIGPIGGGGDIMS